MNKDEIKRVLAKPIAQELLKSNIPARVAYIALDGTPRVIPVGYWVGPDDIRFYSPVNSRKIDAMRANPNVSVSIDTTGQMPPRILTLRGTVSINIIDGIPQQYLEASLKNIGPEAFVGFEDNVRAMYKQMAEIIIDVTWAKLIDFEETLPEPVQEIIDQMQQGQS